MLTFFRNFAQHPISKFLLIILALSFAAWGIGDYISGRQGSTAVKVNGQAISIYEIQRVYNQQRQAISQQLGGQTLPDEALAQLGLPQEVLTNVIRQELLKQAGNKLRLTPAHEQVAQNIRTMPAFQQAGTFNTDLYKQSLRTAGYTVQGFEEALAADIQTQLLSELFTYAPTANKLVEPLVQYDNTAFDIAALPVRKADITVEFSASDASLTTLYERFKNLYNVPEQRSFDVVMITPADFNRKAATEADLKALYEKTQTNWQTPAQREAQHILVKTEAEAKDLLKQLNNGADFAALAAEHSQDPGSKDTGGQLGWFTKQQMVPTFADAAFSLKESELSTPVESPFGWHIIKVTGTRAGEVQPFASVREQLTKMWEEQAGLGALTEKAEALDDAIAGGATLAEAAASAELKVKTFTKVEQGKALDLPQAVIEEAFAGLEGEISLPVDLPENGLAYIAVNDVTPSYTQPFEDVKDRVTKQAERLFKQQAQQQLANQVIAAAQTGDKSLTELKTAFGLGSTIKTAKAVLRNGENAPEWLPANLRGIVFNTAPGRLVATPLPVEDDLLVVKVTKRTQMPVKQEQVEQAANALQQNISNDLTWLFLYNLHEDANITYNIPMLKQVFGQTFTLNGPNQAATN